MNITQIENNIQNVLKNLSKDTFIYDVLLSYGLPKASITRLKTGDHNLSKKSDEILWKKRLFYKMESEGDLHVLIDELKNNPAVKKHHPRFIVVTDFQTLLSVDTSIGDTLDIPIFELAKHVDFFLPWAGLEKKKIQSENLADIKAAERMGKLYDLLLRDNTPESEKDWHALNIFFSRLLFCFFAEDTAIFSDGQFTNAVASHTAQDGSDLQKYLQKLFTVLNLEERENYPQFLQDFPFVNGGLFAEEFPVPIFSEKARKIIIECGALNWKAINPDIFGSMMQAVVHKEQRSSIGMHYTSVVNIMKVIEPLFLHDLHTELEQAGNNEKKLNKLLSRLYSLRIFDPACGSGNFLIIAYKECCKVEIEIFKRLHGAQASFRFLSKIQLTQFYGIELDDFAYETAKLSLWLAEHQMNLAFNAVFGEARSTLPLQDGGNIVCGNATRVNWLDVCPKEQGCEYYVLGNPPYAGQRNHTNFHREDMAYVFRGEEDFKKLDYISCWFYKAAKYLDARTKFSFVTTNSICQGTQVAMLWPRIFKLSVEIFFSYAPFKWRNNARNNAGVTCTIIGLRPIDNKPKYIFEGDVRHRVDNINAYLVQSSNIIIKKRLRPLSKLPKMQGGNQPREGGHLMLSDLEKKTLLEQSPRASRFIRPLMGSSEFIKGIERWCVWIDDEGLQEAQKIPQLKERIAKVQKHRTSGNSVEKSFAHVPHRFVTVKRAASSQILIPIVSSENRKYIPIGLLGEKVAITSKAFVIFDCATFVFSVLNSLMHMVWVKAVSGRLGTGISYSSEMCFNTFPFPEITDAQEAELEKNVFAVLDEREKHPEKTMAELYDPEKMPHGLQRAHHEMDLAVERCYRQKPFENDEKRLEYLFSFYEKMTRNDDKQGKLNA